MTTSGPVLTDFVLVKLYLGDSFHLAIQSPPTEVIVCKDDVLKFLVAVLNRHYSPGVHPETGEPETPVQEITLSRQEIAGPYWWTGPSLQDDDTGVKIYPWVIETTVWRRSQSESSGLSIPPTLKLD